ncbi:MAG: RDD family protein [Dehalococcoidia bacterium]
MSSVTATSGGPAATDSGLRPPGRRQRCAAVLLDFLTAALAVAAAALLATLWLLVRTGRGREDATSGDSLVATALVLAAPPAWAAWQLVRVRRGAGTAGQARVSLAVTAHRRSVPSTRTAATLRLLWHPLAVTAWLWLAALSVLFDAIPAALVCLGLALVWVLAGVASAALVLRNPAARALHDRLAGTSLCRR